MVDILMATYNGDNYIENQILSIISQTQKDWRLLIHDDGSTDHTHSIIKKYEVFDQRIKLINDAVQFKSAAANFMHLLTYAHSEFIVFCDQDDVWFESKLEILIREISAENGPCAVYCNAYLYDGKIITADKVTLFNRDSLKNSLFLNSGVQGSSLMFNRSLLRLIQDFPAYIVMHDHLITMAAVTFGKLKNVDFSLMLYRQHTANVTGHIEASFFKRVKMFLFGRRPVVDTKHYEANISFYQTYKERMQNDQIKLFEAYRKFPKVGLWGRLKIIINNDFNIGGNRLVLLLKVLIRKPI